MTEDVFFLDSADLDDVGHAAASGVVAGVTTNPTLLRRAAGATDPVGHLGTLLEIFTDGPVFVQLQGRDRVAAHSHLHRVLDQLAPAERLIFKLPAQPWWFAFGAELIRAGHRVAITAVYQPGQLLAATQIGAAYVIPYVDRAGRLRPEGDALLPRLRSVAGAQPRILAASLKSAAQTVSALACGADAITAPWQVLQELMCDELTDAAVEEFDGVVCA